MISFWRTQGLTFADARQRLDLKGAILEAAAIAHRRLKNNLNPTLVLHQFILDIPPAPK
jgi:hypothetical protein